MGVFRYNNDWLRYKVLSQLKKEHPDLFQSSWKTTLNNMIEYSFDQKRWWFIIIIVIVFFSIGGLININYFNHVDLTFSTAKILVDQRASNIAAIMAITLVVVGFLINNLAVKEPLAYQLLFKYSFLYPIIYFTLSTIGCFFIISTLRNEFYTKQFDNMVLAGTYLSITILFLIGFLFKTVIQFTNDKTIKNLFHKELVAEAKHNLKSILLREKSAKLIKDEMNKIGAKEYDFFESLDIDNASLELVDSTSIRSIKKNDKYYIYDINIKKLGTLIKKHIANKSTIYFQDLFLGKNINSYNNILIQKGTTLTDIGEGILTKNLCLKKTTKSHKNNFMVKKYFDHKLEELTNNNDFRNLEDLLESYYELYELQMNNQNESIN